MTYKFKYRLLQKIEDILLNKKAMVALAFMAPVMFSLSALYLGGYFGDVTITLPEIFTQRHTLTPEKQPEPEYVIEEKNSIFKDVLRPLYAEAISLSMPNMANAIPLVQVGLDKDEALEAPKDWQVGGWYKFGARPGEQGNVIIAAHYDDSSGRPGAFWQLKNLKVDDKVSIEDRYGKLYTYSVTESFLVSINDPNRLQIFEGDEDHSILTLVTCGGVWLPGRATYDKRLVVKAQLVAE